MLILESVAILSLQRFFKFSFMVLITSSKSFGLETWRKNEGRVLPRRGTRHRFHRLRMGPGSGSWCRHGLIRIRSPVHIRACSPGSGCRWIHPGTSRRRGRSRRGTLSWRRTASGCSNPELWDPNEGKIARTRIIKRLPNRHLFQPVKWNTENSRKYKKPQDRAWLEFLNRPPSVLESFSKSQKSWQGRARLTLTALD